MAYRDDIEDDWDDGVDLWNEYDDDELTEDEPTVACPYCGEEIHEDAQRCPHCGQYISEEDRPPARKSLWIIIGALAVMYVVYRWTVG